MALKKQEPGGGAIPNAPVTPAAPAPSTGGGGIFNQLGQGVTALQGNVNASVARTTTQPNPNAGVAPSSGSGSGTGNPALDAIAGWVDTMFEHYLGRPASTTELNTIVGQGWTPDRLQQHLRAQPSYVPGLTIGGYEDLFNVSNNEFLKYTGSAPTDQDIRDLAQKGFRDQFAINNYLKNRPDVVALHPGAPVDLADEQWNAWKGEINGHYQQNLGKDASDEEARGAYMNRNSAPPAKQQDLSPQLGLSQQGTLEAKNMLSPTARAM